MIPSRDWCDSADQTCSSFNSITKKTKTKENVLCCFENSVQGSVCFLFYCVALTRLLVTKPTGGFVLLFRIYF